MQMHEYLHQLAPHITINKIDMPNKLLGLNVNEHIYLNSKLDNYYKTTAILAEEIAHYLTSDGDISDYRKINSARAELKARRLTHRLLVPLEKLIECYKLGLWGDLYEMCLYLEIDRSYFEEVIKDYKSQFGTYVEYEGFLISFEPLEIEEL